MSAPATLSLVLTMQCAVLLLLKWDPCLGDYGFLFGRHRESEACTPLKAAIFKQCGYVQNLPKESHHDAI